VLSCSGLLLAQEDLVQTSVQVGQGYRRDWFKFNISGCKGGPDILSELTWKNMDVHLSTLRANVTKGDYVAAAEVAYGNIVDGKMRDSDYASSRRIREFSRSYSKISGDYTLDALAKIGRKIAFENGYSLTPSLGYGAFWLNMRTRHGKRLVSKGRDLKQKHFHGLNTTYKARWMAPFVNLLFTVPLRSNWDLSLGYSFFFPVRYRAKARWNLRDFDFEDVSNKMNNLGQKLEATLSWACTERVGVHFTGAFSDWITRGGRVTHAVEKGNRYPEGQRFRKSHRQSLDTQLSLSYDF